MNKNVADIEDFLIDFYVAEAEGYLPDFNSECRVIYTSKDSPESFSFKPSKIWADGGPIIEREKIDIRHIQSGWAASIGATSEMNPEQLGDTPLIAAMRTYIAFTYGQTIPDKYYLLITKKQRGFFNKNPPDREFVLNSIKHNGMLLKYALPSLRADKEIVQAALHQNGNALKYVAPLLKNNRDIVLLVVSQYGPALKYAASQFKADREIVLAANEQNGKALEYVNAFLQHDWEVLLAAFKQKQDIFEKSYLVESGVNISEYKAFIIAAAKQQKV